MRFSAVSSAVFGLVLVFAGPAWADKVEAIERLIETGKDDQAREKCDKWGAHLPDAEEGVREACARAFWIAAERRDDTEGWREFRANGSRRRLGRGRATRKGRRPCGRWGRRSGKRTC